MLVGAVAYVGAHDTLEGSCSSSAGSCHTQGRPWCKAGLEQENYSRHSLGVVIRPEGCREAEPSYCKEPVVAEQGSFHCLVRRIEF